MPKATQQDNECRASKGNQSVSRDIKASCTIPWSWLQTQLWDPSRLLYWRRKGHPDTGPPYATITSTYCWTIWPQKSHVDYNLFNEQAVKLLHVLKTSNGVLPTLLCAMKAPISRCESLPIISSPICEFLSFTSYSQDPFIDKLHCYKIDCKVQKTKSQIGG